LARRAFAERLATAERVDPVELPEFLAVLRSEAPSWGAVRRWRSVSLLLVYVARSTRACRAAFVAEGLTLLGQALKEGVAALETGGTTERQEASMWVLASLACLRALPIGRATMWQNRLVLGKPFDRLHRWCGHEKSALAADLRGPTSALCRRWRRQPQPAEQDKNQKDVRLKVVSLIAQGLAGMPVGNSPASPAMPLIAGAASPGPGMPPSTLAAEIEAALFGRHGGKVAHEYRQHSRMLRSNLALPGNAPLRAQILSGDISADELVAMESDALAPASLQEERRLEQAKATREMVVRKLRPPPVAEDARDRSPYNPSTAPLPPQPSRSNSGLAADAAAMLAESSAQVTPAAPAANAATALTRMEPPPTPFVAPRSTERGGTHDLALVAPGMTPDVLPTPAQDERDEEELTLIQWLSNPL